MSTNTQREKPTHNIQSELINRNHITILLNIKKTMAELTLFIFMQIDKKKKKKTVLINTILRS